MALLLGRMVVVVVVVVATDLEERGVVVLGSNRERRGREHWRERCVGVKRERERKREEGKNAVLLVVKMDNRVLCDKRPRHLTKNEGQLSARDRVICVWAGRAE